VSSSSNLNSRRRREERLRELEARKRELRRHSAGQIEHTLSEKYESLDYEIVENELYRAAEKDKDHQVKNHRKLIITLKSLHLQRKLFRQTVNRWVVCFLIGVFTATVAAFIDILVYYNSKLKFHVIISGSKFKYLKIIYLEFQSLTFVKMAALGIRAVLGQFFLLGLYTIVRY
jgi:hypothetical protein